MDDILIYLIFLAFALLSRFLSKKKGPEESTGTDTDAEQPERRQKPVSFEDLLREFTGEGEVKPAHAPKDTYQEEYSEEEYDKSEGKYIRDDEARDVYNKSINEAKNLKTIDELVDYDKIKTTSDIDAEPEKKKETFADEIRKQLKDPDEVRKAVIYSEILQRKY